MKTYRIKYYWGIHVFTTLVHAKDRKEAVKKFKNGTGGTADILNIKEVK